jgi:hypothetical protein
MDYNTWTFGNWEPGQNNGFRPHEDGYYMDPSSSPISQSPDALHIHRELPGFYSNIGECMRLACLLL